MTRSTGDSMKILLMPPLVQYVDEPPNTPDLGLLHLAAALRNANHTVLLQDWNMSLNERNFVKFLEENRPKLVGLKVFTKDVAAARKTSSLIRMALPETTMIVGGPHPSASDPSELMSDFDLCDFAIRGEAERSFPALVSALPHNTGSGGRIMLADEAARAIPGLVWRSGNEIKSNEGETIHDLEALELPAWDLADPNVYDMVMLAKKERAMKCAPIIATRGCPGNCSFCSAHLISGKPIRRRTAESVVNEIEYLMETFGIRVFSFQDNCFTSNGDNLRIICELLLKRDMDIFWDCNCYQTLTNLTDENLDLMRRAGCRMIHMGIESASPRIRKTLRKGCDLAEVTEVAERIKSRGIRLGAWFMLGFPGETMADMIATVKYALALKAAFVSFTPCFPLPGTVVYRDVLEKYGITRLDWSRYNVKTDSHAVSTISSRKLIGLIRVARLSLRLYDKIRQGP